MYHQTYAVNYNSDDEDVEIVPVNDVVEKQTLNANIRATVVSNR